MKFTPETLIEIYLNGSFTAEAQTEFDRLMRKDPAFAEQVTKAVAERVGAVPDFTIDQVSARLDGNIDSIWKQYKPSAARRIMKRAVSLAVLLAALGGFYAGFRHFEPGFHRAADQGTGASSTGGAFTTGIKENGTVMGNSGRSQTSSAESGSFGNGSEDNVAHLASAKKSTQRGEPDLSSAMTSNGLPATVDSRFSTPPPFSSQADNPALARETGNPAVNSSQANHSPAVSSVPRTEEGDALRVSIETEKTQDVIVNVLDSNGLLVRHLYQGVWQAGVHLVDWDGKDEVGNPVAPGNYTVVVNAEGKTMSGNVTVQPNR